MCFVLDFFKFPVWGKNQSRALWAPARVDYELIQCYFCDMAHTIQDGHNI